VRRVLALTTTLSTFAITTVAHAQLRSSLDDFYERGRTRADPLEACARAECASDHVVAFDVGASLADPVFSDGSRRLAVGGHASIDAARAFGPQDVIRSIAIVDVYRALQGGQLIADVDLDSSFFWASGEPGQPGVHVAINPRIVERGELQPHDLAELRLSPYRLYDVEAEVAPTGPKIDKDAFFALPIGVSARRRWTDEGVRVEDRRSITGALAARGFPKGILHHDQLDFARLTRTWWSTPTGDASAWTTSAGYQRLSPDLAGIELWILAGYGWFHAGNDARGVLGQIGFDAVTDETRALGFGLAYDANFQLDVRTNTFVRVHDLRASYHQRFGPTETTIGWEGVAVYSTFAHALTLGESYTRGPIRVAGRYRLALSDEAATFGLAFVNRFEVTIDAAF
jgi:hypothetical protein